MALPSFVAIKSASKETYLQLPNGNGTSLIFKELGVDSKGVKHEVVKATSGDELVHIKCCHNKKYWALAGTHGNFNVSAEADNAVEDGTSPACTLIKPSLKNIGGVTVVNFHFLRQSVLHSISVNDEGHLQSGENREEDFIISDWEKLSSTPK